MRMRTALAIVEGDAELAALSSRRASETGLAWMEEDHGGSPNWQAVKLPAFAE